MPLNPPIPPTSARPRVSILIPNFNNGRQSSGDGQTDLIGDLLRSLFDTLAEDPTPTEIIAYDDGSTDDSLDTLREWSQRTWRHGQKFLQLIEAEHHGVLARTSNVLCGKARGDILVRLDGDTVMLTPKWVAELCRVFDDAPERLGIIGPKQLTPSGHIHAFGDFVLHPKGYHHVAQGRPRHAVSRAMEVDHVMGCFYCMKRAVFEQLRGFDEDFLRGQTIDFGLRARLKGWSCIAVPQIEFIHRHGTRGVRATEADSQPGIRKTLDVFQQKWGFNRIAPDLDVVRERYAGTALLWNAAVFATPTRRPVNDAPPTVDQSPWGQYTRNEPFKQAINFRVGMALDVVRQTKQPKRVGVIGGQCGLIAHLLTQQSLPTVDLEPSAPRQALAKQVYDAEQTDKLRPIQRLWRDRRRLPLSNGEVEMLLIFDELTDYDNPIALLREAWRVLAEGGLLVIVTERPSADHRTIHDPGNYYMSGELLNQLQAVGGWRVCSNPNEGNPAHPLVVVAARQPRRGRAAGPAAERETARSAAHAA